MQIATSAFFVFICFSTTAVYGLIIPVHKKVDITESRTGWTAQPPTRGTLDVLVTCITTMILCSWSIMCLNIPGPKDKTVDIICRRLWLTALGLLGPEFTFTIAFGQWASAKRSVEDFHAAGYPEWTMTHAFFANMGGFVLHSPQWSSFPLDAKQLLYLVERGYLLYPKIDVDSIKDRNKEDSLLRFITIYQVVWFFINVAGRFAQNLAISCLEITTAAFVIFTIATSLCWAHKPADIRTTERLDLSVPIRNVIIDAGSKACAPYRYTPLDFISREEWPWSKYWAHWINIIRPLRLVSTPDVRPIDRAQNTRFLYISPTQHLLVNLLTGIYLACFVIPWKFNFPTAIEQLLWHISVVTMLACLISYALVTEFFFSWYPAIRIRKDDLSGGPSPLQHTRRYANIMTSITRKIRNNSALRDEMLDVPVLANLALYIIGFLYCVARTYVFVEDIIELRSLPASAYLTVDFSRLISHN